MKLWSAASLGCIAIAALGGCNQLFGFGDEFELADDVVGPIDAGSDASPFDCPPAPPMTMIGCATITHVHSDGTTSQSRKDLSRYTAAAYIPDASAAGFAVISGTTSADGVVTIAGVPDAGPYYLRLHDPQDPFYPWPRYFYTERRDLELGYVELGRDDTPVTLATPVSLSLTGLRPWQAMDSIQLVSFAAGTEVFPDVATTKIGATALDVTTDWFDGVGENTFSDITSQAARTSQLIDTSGATGDDLWILHNQTTFVTPSPTMRGYRSTRIVAYLRPTDVTMTDGVEQTISGALETATPIAGNQIFQFNLDALRTAIRDEGRYLSEDIGCIRSANPGAGHGLMHASIASFSGEAWAGDRQLALGVEYTNPFPASWPNMMRCSFSHRRSIITPGSNRRLTGDSYVSSYTTGSDDFTWTPGIRPPGNVRVGGVAGVGVVDGIAGGAVAFDGVAPVEMSWDAVAGVNRYQIRVRGADEGFVAAFDTFETSVRMPGDIFTKGEYYQFRVFAIQTTGDYAAGDVYDFPLPLRSARLSTGLFLFSDECGDSDVDTGEQCDTGGSSTTCDADCSLVTCGDGFLNGTVETCDETQDAPNCDADCTLPMCGDGHWNPTVEECEDGNAVDTDDCSNLCVLNSCGNGTTEPAFEGCDDSNRLNGDGCSAFCQPEMPT